MKTAYPLLVLCLSLGAASGASPSLVDIQDGPTLAAYLRSLRPAQETSLEGTLHVISRKEGERVIPFTSHTRIKAESWEITYETARTPAAPPQRLTVVHTSDQPNVYLYSNPAGSEGAPEQRGLPVSNACTPFAGSDFWLADLGLDFFHWPSQKLLEPEMRKGRPCKVLESRPAADNSCAYGRIVSWVDNETGGVIMAAAYDKQDRRIKEFEIKSFAKVDGRWQLQEMRIQDLKERSRTLLRFDLTIEAE